MFHYKHQEFKELFKRAELKLRPAISMVDLVLGDVISGNIAFNGFYEFRLSKEITRGAVNGGLLVDVGANMGYFSLLWAATGIHCRSIAFEASPRNLVLLKQNVRANGLDERITIRPQAVGHLTGTVAFDVGPLDQTGWGGISNSESTLTISVPLVRLDEELRGEWIEILKIDVEGADTWVIQGCDQLLEEGRVGVVYFEQNLKRMALLGIKPGEAQQFLAQHGYVSKPLTHNGDEWVARRRARFQSQ